MRRFLYVFWNNGREETIDNLNHILGFGVGFCFCFCFFFGTSLFIGLLWFSNFSFFNDSLLGKRKPELLLPWLEIVLFWHKNIIYVRKYTTSSFGPYSTLS